MARPHKEAYELLDAEKRDLIQRSKALPEKYRFILFDGKHAVDKGQVRFHDISFVEATPRYNKKDKFTLQIELTDFSVYYTQSLLDAVPWPPN